MYKRVKKKCNIKRTIVIGIACVLTNTGGYIMCKEDVPTKSLHLISHSIMYPLDNDNSGQHFTNTGLRYSSGRRLLPMRCIGKQQLSRDYTKKKFFLGVK